MNPKQNLKHFEPEVDMLPSPATVARILNEKTIPVSLRVNEKTQAFFDSQAATYNVSGNVMMSLLLDRYVDYQENVASRSEDLNLAILRKHLERCVKIVKKADNFTLLRTVLDEGDGSAAMSITPDEVNAVLQDYVAACDGSPDRKDLDLHVWTVDADFHCIEGDPNHSAFIDSGYAEETHCYFYDLFISPRKWPVVIYLAKAYEYKIQQLFPGDNEQQTYARATMGKQFYRDLIDIINSTDDRAELAQKVASAYLAAQGIEEFSASDSDAQASQLAENSESNPPTPANTIESAPFDLSKVIFGEKTCARYAPINNVALVIMALEQLRGVQHFNRIVDRTQSIRLQKYPDTKIPEKFDSVISNTLQTHSSDLRSYNGKDDYFLHPAPGYWGLRPGVHTDEDGNIVVD